MFCRPNWLIITSTWILYRLTLEGCAFSYSNPACNLPSINLNGLLSRTGDIILGGTFRIHMDRPLNNPNFRTKPKDIYCEFFGTEHYLSMQALIFAVEEINADCKLLPNITLGFQIFDSCLSPRRAAQGTLWILSGGQGMTPNYHCDGKSPLAGIIGDSGSTQSILMAHILSLYRVTQISYFSSHPVLSNRDLFASFLRTIPTDEIQIRALTQTVSYFGWTWVGILAEDDDSGEYGSLMAQQEIMNAGACVAFNEKIMLSQPNRNAPHIVQIIKESTAKAVIVLSADSDFLIVVEELLRQNVTGKIWLTKGSLSISVLLSQARYREILLGTISIISIGRQMPEFTKYLTNLHPSNDLDLFIKDFWENNFSCKWLSHLNLTENSAIQTCTGNEKLEFPMTEQRMSFNIYMAAYSFAWALQSLLHCVPGSGPFHQGSCANITSFYPWQLLYYIKKVNFKTKDRTMVYFDDKGNPPPVCDILNWHVTDKGKLKQDIVGYYHENVSDGLNLKVNTSAIIWTNYSTEVPLSRCSSPCPVGFRKLAEPSKPHCCHDCSRCPQGQISNQSDVAECDPCPWDMWPNIKQDRCLPRKTEFLSYEEPLGYSLAAISIFSSLIPLIILGVFIFNKKTPVVRANNYSISCLLLVSLFLCFLSTLGFIGYPQPEKCLLRQVAFGMVFTLCISCVLAKTTTVVIAFKATKPGSWLRKWTGVKVSCCVIVFCLFVQLCICVMWLVFSSPFTELDIDTKPGVIIVNCNEGSPTAFWCILGYLGLLATISFIVAFLARQLPDSFNEAKFITFSMLAFLSVWVSFIPAYLSARGMYTTAMEVFAILSSTWAVVVCIFVPKCFIVLFRPNMNSREHLMRKDREKQ